MDNDTRERIKDYFEAFELVEFLGITIDDVMNVFESEIEALLPDIEELMGLKHG